jgi:hypothetical protein
MRVTGPKQDLWLVKTVGALVIVIGAAIGLAAVRTSIGEQTFVLAAGSAPGAGGDRRDVCRKTSYRTYLSCRCCRRVGVGGVVARDLADPIASAAHTV